MLKTENVGSSKIMKRRVRIMHETEKAYHIKFVSGKKTGWVPKSMVEVYDWKENNMTAYETCMMDMPFWLYEKIGKK